MLVSSPCVLYLLWRPGRVCASSGSRVAPTEACKACQCILSKSGQRREPSIMEKTQSPSPGHLGERAGRASPGSRGSRPIRPPLAERQPGLFCERLQSPVRVSQLTMERLCRFRFHFHQRGKRSTMGQCPRLGNRTRFSLGFPGLGTWKRPEPRQTREAGQILRYAFLVAIKHISSYHLMGSLCLWGKGRCCWPRWAPSLKKEPVFHTVQDATVACLLCACGCLSHRTKSSCSVHQMTAFLVCKR